MVVLSNAERQAAYRQRKLKDGTDVRLSLVVSAETGEGLTQLAKDRKTSKRAVVEALVHEAAKDLPG